MVSNEGADFKLSSAQNMFEFQLSSEISNMRFNLHFKSLETDVLKKSLKDASKD